MKKLLQVILLSTTIALLTNCGNSSSNQQEANDQQIQVVQTEQAKQNALTNFTKEDLARFTISSIMGQSSKNIKVRFKKQLYYVSYIRKSDSKKFDYKIKIDGNTILWANIDGRWRDSEYDEKISFEEKDNTLKIIQTFSDGSTDVKEFKKGE